MPLSPILMRPAYRAGGQTPWGGDKLRAVFGRSTPGPRTGESLEISAIKGLNSTDESGRTLEALISLYGSALVGRYAGEKFPLLLKIIDAKERLSVQVHPDDAYAAKAENKRGKTEAWVILSAEEGAELIYGLNPNVTRESLRAAALEGRAVEGLLRRVPVKQGDALFIPAGTVHAIGGGIVLYEIQQSSDVTYRFYDWDRRDSEGNKRELHLDKALDVCVLSSAPDLNTPEALPSENGKRERLISCEYFETLRLTGAEGMEVSPPENAFAMLTAVEKGRLWWEGGEISLPPLTSALLPNDGFPVKLDCPLALLSYPR